MMRDHPISPEHPIQAGSDGVAVWCRRCGPVAIAADLTTIFGDIDTGTHHLAFFCPDCNRRATQFVPVEDVAELVLSGVSLRALTRPTGANETIDAPPIGDDEIDAFAARLTQPGCESELLR